jgi:hypothetical protein
MKHTIQNLHMGNSSKISTINAASLSLGNLKQWSLWQIELYDTNQDLNRWSNANLYKC